MRILLVEDHQIVRQGLRALLEKQPHFETVAETGDGLEAVDLVEELQPDVVVLDLTLPGLDGLEVLRRIVDRAPEARIVMLSMHNNEAYVAEAVEIGATGYVLKESSADDLVAAIRAVSAGQTFFSEGLAVDSAVSRSQVHRDRYDSLTPREREVLHLLAEGRSGPEVAERLFISPKTVDTYRERLKAKLGAASSAQLLRRAALEDGDVALLTDDGVAVASQKQGLLDVSQHAMTLHGKVAYHDYEGIALELDERERGGGAGG